MNSEVRDHYKHNWDNIRELSYSHCIAMFCEILALEGTVSINYHRQNQQLKNEVEAFWIDIKMEDYLISSTSGIQ